MTLTENQEVTFSKYANEGTPEECPFSEGDKLKVVEVDDTGETPCYLCSDEQGTQGYVFASEVTLPEEKPKQDAKKATKKAAKKKALKVSRGKAGRETEFKGYTADSSPAEGLEDLAEGSKVLVTGERNGMFEVTVPAGVAGNEDDITTVMTPEELGKEAPAKATDKNAKKKAAKKAPAKKAAAKAPSATEEESGFEHAPSIVKLIGKTADKALKSARTIADRIEGDFYALGGVLFEIKNKAYYETIEDGEGGTLEGQPGFEKFIADNLGVQYRMAQHYLNVYEVTRRANIPEEKVKGLKCSKVVKLLDLLREGAINAENWDEWQEKATTLKGAAYEEAVKTAKVAANIADKKGRGTTMDKTRFTFVLFGDRGEIAKKALNKCQELMGAECPNEDGSEHSPSELFDYIMNDWQRLKAMEENPEMAQESEVAQEQEEEITTEASE